MVHDELTPQMRAAVAQRLRGAETPAAIPRRPHPARPAPLSFAQQRLWLLAELFPDGLAYQVPSTHRLLGPLDVDALAGALDEVARRHEVLRTVFDHDAAFDQDAAFDHDAEGHPVQLVLPAQPVGLPVHDVPPGDPKALAADLAVDLVRRPFDLRRGPLLRADLLRLAAQDHVLVLCLHHIAVDERSLEVLLAELSQLYAAFLAGEPAGLPDLPLQYADYAAWQRDQLTSQRLRPHLDYWRRHLDGAPEPQLHTDHPRPATQSFAGARLRRRVEPPVLRRVRECATRYGTTTFAVLLAALHGALTGHLAGSDLTIAVPFDQRARPELEPLIGLFVNTLPLRTTPPAADPTFGELLCHARDVTFDALAHQDLPFDHLVHHLRPHRTLSRNPITQVALSFSGATARALRLPGLHAGPFPIDPGTVVFDLDLVVAQDGDGLAVELAYSTDLFNEPTARAALDRFAELLDRGTAEPQRPLHELVPRGPAPSPAPEPAGPPAEVTEPAAPWTEVEHELAAIWARVLGTGTVGRTDDFFVLGGDSLAAARVAVRVSRTFGVQVPMRAVFDAPTVARFAAQVLAPILAGDRAEDVATRLVRRLAALPEAQALRVLDGVHDPTPQEDQ